MPLGIRLEMHHREGTPDLNVPVVICDYCDQPIERGLDGNYYWRVSLEEETMGEPLDGRIYFTHKHCARAFESGAPIKKGWRWYTNGLDWLPLYLGNVLGVNLKRLAGDR